MIRIRVIPLLNSIQNPLGSEGFQWQFPFSSLVSLQRQSKCSGRHKGLQARQARTHARSNRQLLINSAKTFFPPFSLSQRLPIVFWTLTPRLLPHDNCGDPSVCYILP